MRANNLDKVVWLSWYVMPSCPWKSKECILQYALPHYIIPTDVYFLIMWSKYINEYINNFEIPPAKKDEKVVFLESSIW